MDISGGDPGGIVSGTFSMTLKKSGCPDMEITDGRFDIMIGKKPSISCLFGPC